MLVLVFLFLASWMAFAQPVVSNPTGTQMVNQPSGSYFTVTRSKVTQELMIPGGTGPAPSTPCSNYEIYLQAPTPVFPAGNLWRCLGSHWVGEAAPPPFETKPKLVEPVSNNISIVRGFDWHAAAWSGISFAFGFLIAKLAKI